MDKELMKMLNDWKEQKLKEQPEMTTEEILVRFEEALMEPEERDGQD